MNERRWGTERWMTRVRIRSGVCHAYAVPEKRQCGVKMRLYCAVNQLP